MLNKRFQGRKCKECEVYFSMDMTSVQFCTVCKMHIIRLAETLQQAADRLGLTRARCHQLAVRWKLRPTREPRQRKKKLAT